MAKPTGDRIYACHEPTCSLGELGAPGLFTGGASKELVRLLKRGDPKAEYGEGICPNCANRGVPTDDTHVSLVGSDPHEDIHETVAQQIAAGELKPEHAQEAVTRAVAERELTTKAGESLEDFLDRHEGYSFTDDLKKGIWEKAQTKKSSEGGE